MMNWNGFELATKRRFSLGITDADGMRMKMTGRFLIYRGMTDMTVRGVDLASGEKFIIANTDIEYSSIRAAGDYVIWRTQPWPGVLAGFQLSTREGFVVSTAEMIDAMSHGDERSVCRLVPDARRSDGGGPVRFRSGQPGEISDYPRIHQSDVAEDRRQHYRRAIHDGPGDIRIRCRGASYLKWPPAIWTVCL